MTERQYPLEFVPQCPHLKWLCDHLDGWQFGEQGLIDTILETLGLTLGLCVEYGAGDGVSLPLTIDRICNGDPWRCGLVEIDAKRRESLQRLYPESTVMESLDWRSGQLNSEHGVDVVVIDIDGSDSVVVREMLKAGVRPAVLVVEHMDRNYPIATTCPEFIPQWMLGLKISSGHSIQDTAETLNALASRSGYERIGYNRCNSFFVRQDLFVSLFR